MKKRCKIIYVVESFATGVYSVIKDLVTNLPQSDFEIIIIHSLRQDSPKTYEQDFSSDNIKLKYLPMRSILNNICGVPKLVKIIKTEQPCAVHLHSSKAGFSGRLACKLAGSYNVFYNPHGFSFLRTDVSGLTRKVFYCLEFIASKFGGTLVASSQGEFNLAKKYSSKVVKIENFIDVDALDRIRITSEPKSTKQPMIGITGRITAARNPEMFGQIAERLPEMSFTWFGYALDRKPPSANNITITGFLPREEVLSRLPQLDVYIQTSLWEGMPIAVLEAMALGRPVVATDIIGNNDLIDHGKTGFLEKTVDDFVKRIRELIEDDDLRKRIGTAAAEYVKKHHDLALAIKRYSELYLSGMDPSGRP